MPTAKNIYLVMGQSNATEELAQGFINQIRQVDHDAALIQVNHSGDSIYRWYDKEVQPNLFYDQEYIKKELVNYPHHRIAGVVWFQGEMDAPQANADCYIERFVGFYSTLLAELDTRSTNLCIVQVWHNGDDSKCQYIRPVQAYIADYYNALLFDSSPYERKDIWHLSDPEKVGDDIGNAFLNRFVL